MNAFTLHLLSGKACLEMVEKFRNSTSDGIHREERLFLFANVNEGNKKKIHLDKYFNCMQIVCTGLYGNQFVTLQVWNLRWKC